MKNILYAAFAILFAAAVCPSVASAGDRGQCTRQCGGRAGGEAANPPSVRACFRACMGTSGNSDNVRKSRRVGMN